MCVCACVRARVHVCVYFVHACVGGVGGCASVCVGMCSGWWVCSGRAVGGLREVHLCQLMPWPFHRAT